MNSTGIQSKFTKGKALFMIPVKRPWHVVIVSIILVGVSTFYFFPTATLLLKILMVLGQTDITFGQLFPSFFTLILSGLSIAAGIMLFMMRKVSLYLYVTAVVMNLGWLVYAQYFSVNAGIFSVQDYMKDFIPAAIISIYIYSLIRRGYLR